MRVGSWCPEERSDLEVNIKGSSTNKWYLNTGRDEIIQKAGIGRKAEGPGLILRALMITS